MILSSSYHLNVLIDLLDIDNCMIALLRLYASNKTEIITLFHIINGKKIERFQTEFNDGMDTFYKLSMEHLLNWMVMELQKNQRSTRYVDAYEFKN